MENASRAHPYPKEWLAKPQRFNTYSYCQNSPLNRIDPTGMADFLVAYTQGNSHGDADFQAAAETYANEIRKSSSFDAAKDQVVLTAVTTKEDFINLVANRKAEVAQVALFSHSYSTQGPQFRGDGAKNWLNKEDLRSLKINWAQNGSAYFFGCNTADGFSARFAKSQKVVTFGYQGFASFSTSITERKLFGGTGTYLIDAPGSPRSARTFNFVV